MPDDLKTLREGAAKKALAPKEEPMSSQAWREQADSIIAQSGLDDQTLSELRGDPGYMDAWKKGSGGSGQWVGDPKQYSEYKVARHTQATPGVPRSILDPRSPRTPPEVAQGIQTSMGMVPYPFRKGFIPGGEESPMQKGQRRQAAKWLGLLEGEMAAVERQIRGEDKPTLGADFLKEDLERRFQEAENPENKAQGD